MSSTDAAASEAQKRKDPAYDGTDEPGYVRIEFRGGMSKTKSTTVAAAYAPGKSSTVVYDVPISESGFKCFTLCATLCNPMSCAICNQEALRKYTYVRIMDDSVHMNVPISCLCWIMDTTSMYSLDRDFAQNFSKGGLCSPLFTHCMLSPDCFGMFGNTVVAHGATNGVCCPGGRRIAVPLAPGGCAGGPFFFGFCPIGNEQWVCFPLVDAAATEEFIAKLTAQRQAIVAANNIVPGQAGVAQAPASVEQSRV